MNFKVLKFFILAGLTFSCSSYAGQTKSPEDEQAFEFFRRNGVTNSTSQERKDKLLWTAIQKQQLSNIRALVGLGANVNVKYNGMIALQHCAGKDEVSEVVRTLCELGADVHNVSFMGISPLRNAVFCSAGKNVEILIAHGAKVNVPDPMNGDTPLHLACQGKSSPSIVKSLLKAGANVNAQDQIGCTPLNRLSSGGNSPENMETLSILLKHGAEKGSYYSSDDDSY